MEEPQKKEQDLDMLNFMAKIEFRDMMDMKKKRPWLFGTAYKMIMFGGSQIKARKRNVQKQNLGKFEHSTKTNPSQEGLLADPSEARGYSTNSLVIH